MAQMVSSSQFVEESEFKNLGPLFASWDQMVETQAIQTLDKITSKHPMDKQKLPTIQALAKDAQQTVIQPQKDRMTKIQKAIESHRQAIIDFGFDAFKTQGKGLVYCNVTATPVEMKFIPDAKLEYDPKTQVVTDIQTESHYGARIRIDWFDETQLNAVLTAIRKQKFQNDWTYGDSKNPNEIYLNVKTTCILFKEPMQSLLDLASFPNTKLIMNATEVESLITLQTIWIPKLYRNQKWASKIITCLEETLSQLKPLQRLAIGPLMEEETDYMLRLVHSRHYLPVVPFCFVQPKEGQVYCSNKLVK